MECDEEILDSEDEKSNDDDIECIEDGKSVEDSINDIITLDDKSPNTGKETSDIDLKKYFESKKQKDQSNSEAVEIIDDDDDDDVIEMDGKNKSNENSSSASSSKTSQDNDDIEITGESKPISISLSTTTGSTQNVLFIPSGFTGTKLSQSPSLQQKVPSMTALLGSPKVSAFPPNAMFAGASFQQSGAMPKANPGLAPPKPKSSLDQIELIRYEIHNRVNSRPKYFKPNPSAELGALSKFLFDIGADLIKESVYHDLVTIQSQKKDKSTLTEKEQNDLDKLKEIEKDLHATVGHLKMKMKKKCRACNYQTESTNVMYMHKQYPHEVDEKTLRCAHCKYISKQANQYKFHMESEHSIQPKLYDKKAYFECDLCPYENNQSAKIVAHKTRCLKQFRAHFNLHPSCLTGAEISLCLENIFYKPVVPKNFKIIQQKHAQQQQALAEARRQQQQVQALAAQKNAVAAKKQMQHVQRFPQIAPRAQLIGNMGGMSNRLQMPNASMLSQPIRHQNKNQKNIRPTVANMLSNRIATANQVDPPPPLPSGKAHGGFEVCEICGGYVKDRKALRIHFFYAHRIDLPFNLFERQLAPLYCATCYVRFWTAQGLRKHIDTHKEENATTGVVGKCISCGHHVLNLLIHMRIVHNREVQHYVNALMCMFCGMHFGSRDDVERHIKLTHGVIDPVTGSIKSSQGVKQSTPKGSKKAPPVKGSVCVLCNLNFGRNVDLTRHCMRMHHTCMKCGMVVIDKASLLKHTCLSSPSGTRNCTMCTETGFHPAYFVKHLRDKHLKKFSIKVGRLSKEKIEGWTKRPYDPTAKVTLEISDSSEDDDSPEPTLTEPPVKKTKMGPASFMKRNSQESVTINIDDDDEEEEKKKIEPVEDNLETSNKSSKDKDLKSSLGDIDLDGETKKTNDVADKNDDKDDEEKDDDEKDDDEKDNDEKDNDDKDNDEKDNDDKDEDGKDEDGKDEDDKDEDDKEGSDEDSKSPKPSEKIKDKDGDEAKASPAKRKMGPASFMAKRQKLD